MAEEPQAPSAVAIAVVLSILTLRDQEMWVDAKKIKGRVVAIIQPLL
jgi:hypothetical protein